MNDISTFLDTLVTRLTPEQVFEGNFQHDWKKAGTKWRGKCPHHKSDSGTSFYVDTPRMFWRCAGCEVSGGPIQYLSFLRNKDVVSPRGKDFIDIAKELGAIAGVDFPERDMSPSDKIRLDKLENRRAMLHSVYALCNKALIERSKVAKEYIYSRGFTDADIENLNLGVFPPAFEIVESLTEQGFDFNDIKECGIAYRLENGTYGSSFEQYITIPWLDEYGRPLTMYGRYMAKKPPEGKPKTTALKNPGEDGNAWLSTKKSPLYFDRARNHPDGITVVEGVFDAALLQARGDTSVVAWVAANASEQQLDTLEKHKVKSISFALDPDGAGDKGTISSIRRCLNRGIPTFVVPRLPDKVDPDEFVIKHGIDAWHELKDNVVHGLRHVARYLYADISTDKKLALANESAKEFAASVVGFELDFKTCFWDEISKLTGVKDIPVVSNNKQSLDATSEQKWIESYKAEIASNPEVANVLTLDTIKKLSALERDIELAEKIKDPYTKERVLYKELKDKHKVSVYDIKEARKKLENSKDAVTKSGLSIKDLMAMEAAGKEWLIPGYIPSQGMILLQGTAKDGKTTLLYQVITSLVTGKPFLGEDIKKRHRVLFIEAEENAIQVQKNLEDFGFFDDDTVVNSDLLQVRTSWEILRTDILEQWIDEYNPDFVVIDSLFTVSSNSPGEGSNPLSTDFANNLEKLHAFLKKKKLPSMILYHANKGDQEGAKRSYGNSFIPSKPDIIWDYNRCRDADKSDPRRVIGISGRGISSDTTHIIRRDRDDDGRYFFSKEAESGSNAEEVSLRKRVIETLEKNTEYIRQNDGVSYKVLCDLLGRPEKDKYLYNTLDHLMQSELIAKVSDKENRRFKRFMLPWQFAELRQGKGKVNSTVPIVESKNNLNNGNQPEINQNNVISAEQRFTQNSVERSSQSLNPFMDNGSGIPCDSTCDSTHRIPTDGTLSEREVNVCGTSKDPLYKDYNARSTHSFINTPYGNFAKPDYGTTMEGHVPLKATKDGYAYRNDAKPVHNVKPEPLAPSYAHIRAKAEVEGRPLDLASISFIPVKPSDSTV